MPPKKKSGKKGKKGKKSGKKSAKGAPTGGKENLSELSKEYYLIQIRDLEARLVRYVTSINVFYQVSMLITIGHSKGCLGVIVIWHNMVTF